MISRSSPARLPGELTRQLATAWEDVEYAVTVVAPDNRITYANPACAELYGYTREELMDLPIDVLVAPEVRADPTQEVKRSPLRKKQSDVLAIRKDGHRFNAHIAQSPVLDKRGGAAGRIVIHRDITEEVQAHDLLLMSAETQSRGANESAAIVKLGWIANSSLNVGEVYDQFAVEFRRLIAFDRIAVWGIDSEKRTATAIYVRGVDIPESRVGACVPIETKMTETLVRSRSAVVYGGSNEPLPGSVAESAPRVGLRSMIAVPLIANDLVVAVMVLRSRKADAYDDQDLALVRRAGMQIAGAIANSQLYDTVRLEAEQKQGLAEIGRVVSSSPRIDDVYERFADKVRDLILCDRFAISLADAAQGGYVCAYVSGVDVPELRPGARIPSGSVTPSPVRRRAGTMHHAEDETQLAGQSPGLLSAYRAGLRSFLCVPLFSMNEVIGIMHVCSTMPDAYTERDLTLAERIAGQASGAIANSQLYTQHLLTEDALRESEDRYRILVENANDAIVVIQDGTTVYRNAAWQRMLGHPDDASVDGSFFDHVVPGDRERVLEYHRDLLRGTGAPQEYEMHVTTWAGVELTLETKPRVVTYQNHESVMLVMRDITERKRLQEQLFQAQKMEAIGQLAGGVAHDFNNLLSVILGFSQLADAKRTPGDDELDEHLFEIQKAAQRGANLTRQLMAFSRHQVIEPRVLDINQLIDDLDNMLTRLVKEDIEMVIEPSPRPCMVNVDPGQLEQVIVNLVVNARDAMPNGGKLDIKFTQATVDENSASHRYGIDAGRYAVIVVSDTGVGMSQDVIARIFEPFFTTKDVGSGTGLGLSMSYGIVKQSCGHITVDSEPGNGATFRVYLPEVNSPSDWSGLDEAEGAPQVGNERVLLVEDEPAVLALIEHVLRDNGYAVTDASNGVEALETVRQNPDERIDLLLTDVVMPKMGGRRLASELRKIHPDVKVLYVSGYPDSRVSGSEPIVQDTDILRKPFSLAALATKVRQVLDSDTVTGRD